MSQYSLIEGTNQLVRKNQDNAGTKLFQKHGYHIAHPRYRDYYNGLRRHGMTFMDDLSGVLGGLFGAAGAIAKASSASTPTYVTRYQDTVSASPGGITGSIATLDSGRSLGTITPVSSSFTGGHNQGQGQRVKQYFHLMQHLEREMRHERDPRYLNNLTYVVGFPLQEQPIPNDGPPVLPPPDDTIFGINKKLAIAIGIIAVIIIYVKFIK
jgi:hypothetical protein